MNINPRPLWRLLLLMSQSKEPIQLTCEECLVLLGYDADLLASGIAPDEIYPSVHHHISFCTTCQTKFEHLLNKYEHT